MPFGLDNPQVIFVVVMVFILFVNKVVSLLKENAASRQRGKPEIEWKDVPPLPGQGPRRQQPTPDRIPTRGPQPRQGERKRSPIEEVLTDLFESAGLPTQRPPQRPEQPAPPAARPKAPPALPGKPSAPRMTKDEQEALVRLERRKSVPVLSRKKTVGGTGVAKLLHSRHGLRDAIVAAEILGPPRALRPLDSRQSN